MTPTFGPDPGPEVEPRLNPRRTPAKAPCIDGFLRAVFLGGDCDTAGGDAGGESRLMVFAFVSGSGSELVYGSRSSRIERTGVARNGGRIGRG